MALFKISRGNAKDLPKTYNDGYCYVTIDEKKMYIDTTNDSSGRICLNAAVADSAYKLISPSTNNTLEVGGATVPTYFAGGIPTACSSLSLSTSGNAATATKLEKAVKINLTGSVTGSTLFDGSDDISIDTTINHDDKYLKLTGGNLTGGLTFSDSNGISTRYIDGENVTFAGDLYLNYDRNAPIHVGNGGHYTISADGSYYSGTCAGSSYATRLNSTRTITGNSHAEALQNEFNNYKNSVARNSLLSYYSNAYGNGSCYMGYYLSGYNTTPYGGFFVAHYGTPYYVGIYSGSFTQHQLWKSGDAVTGAVWNDYAECRESQDNEPGYVLIENGDDTLSKSTERLQQFAGISSDTWGFSQGETEKAKTHIAVAGRVLAYPYQDRNKYKPGDAVCTAPGGMVDIMTEEEITKYPHRIVGTVSCVPEYEEWGGGENADRDPVKVNGRIWIKVV